MPELPEVENVRLKLSPLVVGRTVEAVRTSASRNIFLTPRQSMGPILLGHRIVDLTRLGKYLFFEFDHLFRLVIHLGMTGQLFLLRDKHLGRFCNPSTPDRVDARPSERHLHFLVRLGNSPFSLAFRDVRKFGRILLLRPGESHPRCDRLGTDALTITSHALWQKGYRRRVAVKSFLLDQTALAGIGNIYADEMLHEARIHPLRLTSSLECPEWRCLVRVMRKLLQRAIALGGTSIRDYVHPDGMRGQYQLERKVYQRTSMPCPRCGEPIQRIMLAQRSTHFCANCQH